MNWSEIRQIKRFTPVDQILTQKRLIEERPVYYLGKGFLLSFTDRMYNVDGDERKEYGEEGEYALNAYFFLNRNELEMFFKLNGSFVDHDDLLGETFELFDGVRIGSTFAEVRKALGGGPKYKDGESRAFKNGTFQFQNSYISFGDYTLFFFANSKNSILTGFQYTFPN